jgi:hypothetical protein
LKGRAIICFRFFDPAPLPLGDEMGAEMGDDESALDVSARQLAADKLELERAARRIAKIRNVEPRP